MKVKTPKYYIATYGCQMNHKDSQQMAGVLEALGFINTPKVEEANVVIINTCSVRQASEDKVYGFGIKYKEQGWVTKKGNKKVISKNKPLTFVTGCMVGSAKGERQRYDLKILKNKMPWADYFLAPNEEHKLPSILYKKKLIDDWGLKTLQNRDFEIEAKRDESKTAFINISYGCDNFCTFCVVPYARGKEISRPKEEILREVNHAVLRGYSNIMLLGQNVNSWMLTPTQKLKTRKKIGKHPFAQLLREIHKIVGVKKIQFITSNPWDFTQDLVKTLALPKIEKFLHLPIQSGSNAILKVMNRRHTVEEYLELVNEIKKETPNMEFGTDIIVGFPGESEEDFEKTIELFEKMKFRVAYISIYSPRTGTPATKHMENNIPLGIKKERHKRLMKVYEEYKN
ncbi:tRNA (N6-isopentenyl adenosine(37)-C2)-methylthiotransferase MiaB [candidate division WWE3 bacterium CG10_big_fil_rev_8_21_14_0_10_32_10]|uniref:tRNA-2-methylthio-N(6)-dimethylallyladenosine synthase n=1 Tax=candidate division WWE3 bacterium CG10_big_fil_rev_8_21_14_0_10_32_10 TaxID=1975090 RepID=A0A2H0R9D2_UNCKA|nr:MAG: tRNA (N6-isopentenyl adenosine(37)-C2)-methylthiotransferase MiaB [candidate division WWE3 bacterium CG10_big_fil_rev_8_21_14_0_10_32_10]